MASLIERTPGAGLLPVAAGSTQLTEFDPGRITSIAPFKGRDRAVAAALKPLGLGFPGPGRTFAKGAALCIWTGRGQAFLLSVEAPKALVGIAALSDQSDGWAAMRLQGAAAEAVLVRLVPLDLRIAVFAKGATVRSLLMHLPVILTRTGTDVFDILVFRSMAGTAVHDLGTAMRAVAARG